MADIIRTDRLELRRVRMDDAPWINACVRDPQIYRNVGKIPPDQTLEDTKAFLERSRTSWDEGTGYGFIIETGTLPVGMVGGGFGMWGSAFDVGYWIAPVAWGCGYATEAAAAYTNWLHNFVGLKGLTAGYFEDNPSSGRVLRKVGFLPAGRSKYHCLGREALVDCVDMARIA